MRTWHTPLWNCQHFFVRFISTFLLLLLCFFCCFRSILLPLLKASLKSSLKQLLRNFVLERWSMGPPRTNKKTIGVWPHRAGNIACRSFSVVTQKCVWVSLPLLRVFVFTLLTLHYNPMRGRNISVRTWHTPLLLCVDATTARWLESHCCKCVVVCGVWRFAPCNYCKMY